MSHSGFYNKSVTHLFSQRITVFNAKSSGISDLRVVEQMPVSESDQIAVKLVSPGLSVPDVLTLHGEVRAPAAVRVSEGVRAQWEGADEEGFDMTRLGKDGRCAMCRRRAQ